MDGNLKSKGSEPWLEGQGKEDLQQEGIVVGGER